MLSLLACDSTHTAGLVLSGLCEWIQQNAQRGFPAKAVQRGTGRMVWCWG